MLLSINFSFKKFQKIYLNIFSNLQCRYLKKIIMRFNHENSDKYNLNFKLLIAYN